MRSVRGHRSSRHRKHEWKRNPPVRTSDPGVTGPNCSVNMNGDGIPQLGPVTPGSLVLTRQLGEGGVRTGDPGLIGPNCTNREFRTHPFASGGLWARAGVGYEPTSIAHTENTRKH